MTNTHLSAAYNGGDAADKNDMTIRCSHLTLDMLEGLGYVSSLWSSCTSVEDSAFTHCTGLFTLKLDNCQVASQNMCLNLPNLMRVSMENCEKVEYGAFHECTNLRSIALPLCKELGIQCFYGCSYLRELNLPHVRYLPSRCIGSCSNLTRLELPSCTHMFASDLYGCSNLVCVNLNSLQCVGQDMFKNQTKLTELHLDKCEFISFDAFGVDSYTKSGCPIKELNLPSVKVVRSLAFRNLQQLVRVNLPEVVDLGYSAFIKCSLLEEVYCPKCKHIGEHCFKDCEQLKKITLGECEFIDKDAFRNTKIPLEMMMPTPRRMFIHYSNTWRYNMTITDFINTLISSPTNPPDTFKQFHPKTLPGYVVKLYYKLPEDMRKLLLNEYRIVVESSASIVTPNETVARHNTRFFGARYTSCGYRLSHLTYNITDIHSISELQPNVPVELLRFPDLEYARGSFKEMVCVPGGISIINILDIPRCHVENKTGFEDRCRDRDWYTNTTQSLHISPNQYVNDYLYTFSTIIQQVINNTQSDKYKHTAEDIFARFPITKLHQVRPQYDSQTGNLTDALILHINLDNELDVVAGLADDILSGNMDTTHAQLLNDLMWVFGVERVLTLLLQATHHSALIEFTLEQQNGLKNLRNQVVNSK